MGYLAMFYTPPMATNPNTREVGVSGPIEAAKVKPEKVEWLWKERIPKGAISIVAGRPDQGKGLFAAHLAAEVSSKGGNVLYSAAEDAMGFMTRPRLEAAGANLNRCFLWRFRLPDMMDELTYHIREKKIDLVIIDPLAAHLDRSVSRHGDTVRDVLQPLTDLIEQTMTACVIIEHTLKKPTANSHPLTAIAGGGSGAVAAARAAYLLGVDPDDEDARILCKVKLNISGDRKPLRFEVEADEFPIVGDVPMLVFDDEIEFFDPMRFFKIDKDSNGQRGPAPEKKAAAAEWLTMRIIAEGKPVPSGRLIEDAKQAGMSVKTLRRAAVDIGVIKFPEGGGPKCTWNLPDDTWDLYPGAKVEDRKEPEEDQDIDLDTLSVDEMLEDPVQDNPDTIVDEAMEAELMDDTRTYAEQAGDIQPDEAFTITDADLQAFLKPEQNGE